MRVLRSGEPNLKDAYLPQNTLSKFPLGWWVGIQMECFCGTVFELEAGDEVEERPDGSIIHCSHCQVILLLPRGDYPITEFTI